MAKPEVSEFALSTPQYGVVYRGRNHKAAESEAAARGLKDYTITEERRPAAAEGLCVAVGGMNRTWVLVVGEPDPTTFRAAYWIAADRSGEVRLTSEDQAHLTDAELLAAAEAEAQAIGLEIGDGAIEIGDWKE